MGYFRTFTGNNMRKNNGKDRWRKVFLCLSLILVLFLEPVLGVYGSSTSENGHRHTDECYSWSTSLTCGQEESAEHAHTDKCYSKIRGELICGQTESAPAEGLKTGSEAGTGEKTVPDSAADPGKTSIGEDPAKTTSEGDPAKTSTEGDSSKTGTDGESSTTNTGAEEPAAGSGDGKEQQPSGSTDSSTSQNPGDDSQKQEEGQPDTQKDGAKEDPSAAEGQKEDPSSDAQKTDPQTGNTADQDDASPEDEPAKRGDTESQKYELNLYGYNFGGLYKQYTAPRYHSVVIGYPEDVKEYLTFENESALAQIPFTYAAEGLNVEKIGLIEEEENTYAGYKYKAAGFVPAASEDFAAITPDTYNSTYVFLTKEEADKFIADSKGVLYGKLPSAEMLAELHEKGNLAVVWQQEEAAGFRRINISANPNKVGLGEKKETVLRLGFNYIQKGDYTETPLQAVITLDDGLTFSADWVPEIADTDAFAIDPESITISEDRKELRFNIKEIKKDSTSYAYLPVNVTFDVSDQNQTQDKITFSAVNGWGKDIGPTTATINIDRPTIRTLLDDKETKSLFFSMKDKAVVLKVEHGNAVSGPVASHVKVTFPEVVTVKSAEINNSGKNTITNLTCTTEDGISVIEYDVENYVSSSGKTVDIFDLVLDVKDKEEQEEVKADTVCTAVQNEENVLVTKNASVTVTDAYFEVTLYGPQDGWMDMSRGDGLVNSTSSTLRFYGSDDYQALKMHKWTFDENPIRGIYAESSDGSVMVGPEVTNPNTNSLWTLVGFVPISYWSGTIRDRWDPLYGVYYLNDLDACKQLIEDNKGVLYGETPTEEQAQSLAQYKTSSGRAKVICVWYIQEPPKEVYNKYSYDENEEYVPKVHPAAYTTTSNGIDVTIEAGTSQHGSDIHAYNVTFVIPEDYDEDTITLNTEFNDAAKIAMNGFQPGDKLEWNIKVIDHSGRYGYLKNSGAVGTIDYYNTEHFDYSVIGTGFEGYQIENADEKPGGRSALSRVTRRGGNFAIKMLAEVSGMNIVGNPSDTNVGRALYEIGYGAEGEGEDKKPQEAYAGENGEPDYGKITRNLLDDYYLDYLNAAYYAQDAHKDEDKTIPHYTKFSDLSAADYRSLFNSDTGTQVMETNPVLVDAMYYAMYEQSILMSEEVEGIENYKGTYFWMHDWNSVTEGNKYEEVIYNQYEENQTTMADGKSVEHNLQWYQWITGTRNGNNMQDTYFGLAYQFKLVKKIRITKVIEDHKDMRHTLKDAEFSLVMVDEDGEQVEEQPYGLPFEAAVDDDGQITFPALLPGRYALKETKAPEGYILPSGPWYFILDESGEAVFEKDAAAISNVKKDGEEKMNDFWVENKPGTIIPGVGGPGTMPFRVFGSILIAGAGLLFWRRRRTI